ncbi:MAG TPA: hypothetical protein VNT79_08000 [Phycisphaerae bacterium]|nr:hypothetical protein [Phycisphaerae bacterium]
MRKERNAFKLGLFTIVVVAVFVSVLLWISKGLKGEMKPIAIRFAPSPVMPGLSEGSAILIGGQKIGRVITSSLVPTDDPDASAPDYQVEVRGEMRSDIVLRADCSAFAEGPPLGGDGLVKINLGESEEVFTGAYIKGTDPGGFAAILASLQGELSGTDPNSLIGQLRIQLDPEAAESLMAKLHTSLGDINAMTASLAHELTPEQRATLLAKFHEVLDNVSITTSSLRREFDPTRSDVTLSKLHAAMDAINDSLGILTRILATGEAPIANTLTSVETMSANIRDETDPERPESLLARLKETSRLVKVALEDVNTITKTTRDVMVLNRENINRMLMNLKESSDHIKTGLKYVLRNPWRLMNAPTQTEQQQQAIMDAARSFAEAAARIDDATAQLRALAELHEGGIPLDDPDLARIQADLKKSAELYEKAEQEVWRQLGTK